MNGIQPPHFEIGQAVLVDQGLPGEITAVKRGTVRGVLDLPPLNTWLYTVKPDAGGDPQTDVPEYNVVAQARPRRIFNLIDRICRSPLRPPQRAVPLQGFVPNGEIIVPVEAALDLAPQKGKRKVR
jgi:hypothetical protein